MARNTLSKAAGPRDMMEMHKIQAPVIQNRIFDQLQGSLYDVLIKIHFGMQTAGVPQSRLALRNRGSCTVFRPSGTLSLKGAHFSSLPSVCLKTGLLHLRAATSQLTSLGTTSRPAKLLSIQQGLTKASPG